jgi:hypothetical protein
MAPKVAKRPAARVATLGPTVLKRPAVASPACPPAVASPASLRCFGPSLGSNSLIAGSSACPLRKIVIVPMEGRRFTLDVLGSDTIDSVKEKIYDHTSAVMAPWHADGIVPELQRLKYYRPQFHDPDSPITHDHLPLGNQDCGWLLFL